jgi:putative FMN-dependent luciferase-like monooxygenase
MPPAKPRQRLGFFTRLLDQAPPAERYHLATEQIAHAERLGFDSIWVAQHHFHEPEGGLPAPFVFLAQVAARTTRIRLGTAIITLPLELPIRVAEDASVLDIISGGRLEVGVAPGGNLNSYTAFGLDSNDRHTLMVHHLDLLRDAWTGRPLPGGDSLYPVNPGLADRIWQATFSVEGAQRAGRAGDGLMLSRNQPRAQGPGRLSLDEIQNPMIDAYLAALPQGREPRILASRTVFVADDRKEALRFCEAGFRVYGARRAGLRRMPAGASVEEAIAALDIHTGVPEEVIASLQADTALARATDWSVQVHSIDPPHPYILRSIELMAQVVAPALGWQPAAAAGVYAAKDEG